MNLSDRHCNQIRQDYTRSRVKFCVDADQEKVQNSRRQVTGGRC